MVRTHPSCAKPNQLWGLAAALWFIAGVGTGGPTPGLPSVQQPVHLVVPIGL